VIEFFSTHSAELEANNKNGPDACQGISEEMNQEKMKKE